MIIAHSLDGQLRLRSRPYGEGVVELFGLATGQWIYCAFRSLPYEKALEMFEFQCKFHMGQNRAKSAQFAGIEAEPRTC